MKLQIILAGKEGISEIILDGETVYINESINEKKDDVNDVHPDQISLGI